MVLGKRSAIAGGLLLRRTFSSLFLPLSRICGVVFVYELTSQLGCLVQIEVEQSTLSSGDARQCGAGPCYHQLCGFGGVLKLARRGLLCSSTTKMVE